MLVVEPTTLRYEEEAAAATQHDGQLAERVSMLENRLLRFAERLEQALGLLLKQSQMALTDHVLLDTLVGLLAETGVVDRKTLNGLWRAALDENESGKKKKSDVGFLMDTIAENYQGEQKDAFLALVGEGLELLAQGKQQQANGALERAAALSPQNSTLNFIIGLQFFRDGKFTLAHVYLQRAHEVQSVSPQTLLLLGIACGDDGEVEQSQKLLRDALQKCGTSFAAHYALGRLSAIEDDWAGALAEFKQAHAAKSCAETHYVLALAHARLGRFRTALGYAAKAVESDETYAEAFRLLGFIQAQLGATKLAREASATALALGAGAKGAKKGRAGSADLSAETLLHAFFGAARHRRKRLLTGGDKRLAALLREDALTQVGYGTLTPAR